VAPSLLAADFSRLAEEMATVEAAGAEVLHLDVMDGHFVPNISFGVPVIRSLRKRSKMFFDAHLMITDPARYAEAFVEAGCDHLTFHAETVKSSQEAVERIRDLGVSVGVSLNPTTPAEALDSIIEAVDLVLVMSVWPGFGGQTFIEDVLPKVEALRGQLKSHQRLEIDGGIDVGTIGRAVAAGADLLVAGSAVFGRPDPAEALEELRRLAAQAVGSVLP
jgi:ribulose-phosphate 3-epimerase